MSETTRRRNGRERRRARARRPRALPGRTNAAVAERLDEVAVLLTEQEANPFRVQAYRRAADLVRAHPREMAELFAVAGLAGLESLPGIGAGLARAIRDLVLHGRLPVLERLRGESDPVRLLRTVPGIGRVLADTLHHRLGVESLEELEVAAHDGTLAALPGVGPKRLAGIRAAVATRLARPAGAALSPPPGPPPVRELLDVDREYREKAAAGALRTIAPRRMNPGRDAWLPVLHTRRGRRQYTALFSNTPRAHRLGTTRDWVVLYHEDERGGGEGQHTVITSRFGALEGHRIVRGREAECLRLLRRREWELAVGGRPAGPG